MITLLLILTLLRFSTAVLTPTLVVTWNAKDELYHLQGGAAIERRVRSSTLGFRAKLNAECQLFWATTDVNDSGIFARYPDGSWNEFHGHLLAFSFKEVESWTGMALLFDASRIMWIRLTDRQSSWAKGARAKGPPTKWAKLAAGAFVTSAAKLVI